MFAILIALISFCSIPYATNAGGKPTSDMDAIKYIELGSDQGLYAATIKDGDVAIPVIKLSFGGDTTLDGIKKEQDSSVNKISLGEVAEIKVLDPLYDSGRYPEQEFCLVRISTVHGESESMLMPRNLLICAESVHSRIKKSWSLRTLKSITIHHDTGVRTSTSRINYKTV